MEPSLRQVQSLGLHIGPKLLRSIEILQMPSAELSKFLREQSEQNPVLEFEWDPAWLSRSEGRSGTLEPGGGDWLDRLPQDGETLERVLLIQLEIAPLPDPVRKAARFLAGNVDENGYLTIGLDEASRRTGWPEEVFTRALAAIQSLEPPGVGARNVRECLLLQIARHERAPRLAYRIVAEFLDELIRGKFARIAEQLDVSEQEVRECLRFVRELEPRPGIRYGRVERQTIVPDVFVRKRPDGFEVAVNDRLLPRLSIDSSYLKLIGGGTDREAEAYLRALMESARWLVRCVEERKRTVRRVAEAIVAGQRAFFQYGKEHLKPMKMGTIAERVGLSVSTVSRTAKNKYMLTPHGVFAMKFFFSPELATDEGSPVSSVRVKEKIRRYIENEAKTAPLSDQQLADLLRAEGIRVSRRTVMKYREELFIPPSKYRRSAAYS